MFPLDCCVYVTASHLSIACAVPLPLTAPLGESASKHQTPSKSVWDSDTLQQMKPPLRRRKNLSAS